MNKLKKHDRIQRYLSYLNNEPKISNKNLFVFGEKLGIPEITVRRDIQLLEKLNYVTINMGIIKLNEFKEYETTREEKLSNNRQEKIEIALKAINELNSNNIFVGAGTTCEFFVKSINKNIDTLYTNGIEIAKIASNNHYIKNVIVIGGKLRIESGAMCGPNAISIIENMKFNQTFITATNIDESFDIFNNNDEEAFLTKQIINKSQYTICLIDHTKFNSEVYGNKIVNMNKVNKVITDNFINKEYLKKLNKIIEVV